jgi:hypothetical protein
MKTAKTNKHNLPVISCECGAKILLVPDLREMVRCIEAHAAIHEKKEADPKKAQTESSRIQDLLIKQVFQLAGYKLSSPRHDSEK